MDEVVFLVEHPVAILGRFDPRYLDLPSEVLVTSMKKHQKFFPVFEGQEGAKLLSHFVGIRNGISENQGVVREGYERVLSARLSDAAFFFEVDRKTPLENNVQALKGIIFLQPLNLLDKTERIRKLAKALAEQLHLEPEIAADADRIALLSKADLVTSMVGEFPELQGVMGRIYASANEKPVVAQGVEQHYWPLTADGRLPETDSASIVSLADKLDSLAGNFLVGNIPSGSQDPYGLRRAAIGMLRILSEKKWALDLRAVIQSAMKEYPFWNDAAGPKAQGQLLDFFKQRWSALKEAEGFRFDEVQAVTTVEFADVVDLEARLKALHDIRKHPDFTPLAVAFKRASNILAQARQKNVLTGDPAVAPERLQDPAERTLFDVLVQLEADLAPLLSDGRKYDEVLKVLVRFRKPVDDFFEKVMVMAPDADVRTNRLSLLNRIAALFRRTADFSLLQDVPAKPAVEKPA